MLLEAQPDAAVHGQRLPEGVDPALPADQVAAVQEVIRCKDQLDMLAEAPAEGDIHHEKAVERQLVLVVLELASLVPELNVSGADPRVIEGERNGGAKARVLRKLLADELRLRPCLGDPRVHEAASGGGVKGGMQSPARRELGASNARLPQVLSLLEARRDRDVRHRVIEQVQEPGGADAPFVRRTELDAGFEPAQRLGGEVLVGVRAHSADLEWPVQLVQRRCAK